ncbi:glutathione S-transferase N-terminal domain-containing protein [Candidatus Igneacidithiobacillus taiwanensis]|nr:glutathione S-transferase N-terminal domain-containing protein [Candidatus Igneacidithiobacillus taiwanensis]
MLTLSHFDFCPFCQRVRLALGYKKIAFAEYPVRFYGPEHLQSISGFDRLPVSRFCPLGDNNGAPRFVRELSAVVETAHNRGRTLALADAPWHPSPSRAPWA